MKQLLRLLFSILLVCAIDTTFVFAQEAPSIADSLRLQAPDLDSLEVDTLLNVADTIPKLPPPSKAVSVEDTTSAFNSKYFLTSVELGIDYLKLLTLLMPDETRYEGFAGILFKNRLLVSIEVGTATLEPVKAYKNAEYIVQGTYGRVGLDYLIHIDPKSNLSLGIRYGTSFYEDDIKYEVNSPLWQNFGDDPAARTNLQSSWYEFVVGTEAMTKKNLFIGAYFRIKKLIDYPVFDPIPLYAVPGYGKTIDKTAIGLNLYIKYKLPLRL